METIILFAPLLGALIAGLTWRAITDAGAQWASTGLAFFAAALSWVVWVNFNGEPQQIYVLDWVRSGTLDAALSVRIDAISAEMMVIVTSLSALAHLYATGFMERDKAFDEGRSFRPRFFAYLSLFTFAMLIVVMSDNLLQLVLGLQVSGVMAYLLICFRHHYKNANAAAIKSFVVGGLGHVGLILGVAGIYVLTDSVTFDDLFEALSEASVMPVILGLPATELCAALILVGAMAVSAQILLHVWVPDAMEAPAPAAALLTGLLMASGAFVIWRLAPLYEAAPVTSTVMIWVGVATAILGAASASAQSDIKRAMGFIACAQIGLIFAALGLELRDVASIQIPLFAVVQAMLVLCVGAVTRAMDDNRDIRTFGGLRHKLPAIALTMTLAAIVATVFGVAQGLLGVLAPETGNLLFAVAYVTEHPAFWAMCVASGLGVFAIWRVVFLSFNGPSRAPQDVYDAVEATPRVMVVALAGFSVLMLGFVAWEVQTFGNLPGVSAPSWISLTALGASAAGFVLAGWFYILQPDLPKSLATSMAGLHKAFKNGFYFDDLYEAVLVKPLKQLGEALGGTLDARVLDSPFASLSTRLQPTYDAILNRRFGGLLLGCGAAVAFGLIAVVTWTVLSGGPA